MNYRGCAVPTEEADEEREKRERAKKEPYMFRDAMLKLLLAEMLPYAKLIAD
jgi:hypothetical protein